LQFGYKRGKMLNCGLRDIIEYGAVLGAKSKRSWRNLGQKSGFLGKWNGITAFVGLWKR
jgi:hypothetical protein